MSAKQVPVVDLHVPDDLSERDQWVLWRYEDRDEKPSKVPYSALGFKASSSDPNMWAPFETAMKAWQKTPRRYAGLGFVFSPNDPFCGIDLDDSLDAEGNR